MFLQPLCFYSGEFSIPVYAGTFLASILGCVQNRESQNIIIKRRRDGHNEHPMVEMFRLRQQLKVTIKKSRLLLKAVYRIKTAGKVQ